MKIVGLVSWYDEDPEMLRSLIVSVRDVVDELLFIDGPYEQYVDEMRSSTHMHSPQLRSPVEQTDAILETVAALRIPTELHTHTTPPGGWPRPGEVGKRREMWHWGLVLARHCRDWLLWIDADEVVEEADPERLRDLLEATSCDVAEVRFVQPGHSFPYRRLFRSLPSLTCEQAHYRVVAYPSGDRRIVLAGNEHVEVLEPAADATGLLTLRHRRGERRPARKEAQDRFYAARDQAGDEQL